MRGTENHPTYPCTTSPGRRNASINIRSEDTDLQMLPRALNESARMTLRNAVGCVDVKARVCRRMCMLNDVCDQHALCTKQ